MKKLFSLFLLSLLLVQGVFANGQKESEKEQGPVVIRIQGYGGQDPAIVVRLLNEIIGQDLAAENIELVYEPIEGDYNAGIFNALSAGTAGDIVYLPVETAPGIIATGQIKPLNGLVDTSLFIESLIDSYTIDGNIYGIPKDFNTLEIFYNKDLFDEAGVEYLTENETWTTIAKKARAISKLGNDIYGICLQPGYDRFGAFAFGTGWTPFDKNGKTDLTDPRFKAAFTWYTDLIKEGAAVMASDLGEGWGGGAFKTEQVGMAAEGSWMIGFLNNEAPNLPYGTAYMPSADKGVKGNFLYTVAYGINKQTKNMEAAVKVLEALTSAKAQQFILEQGLAIPSRKSLADNPFFENETKEAQANKIVFKGASMGNVLGFQFGEYGTRWMEPVNSALTQVASGDVSVDEALATAQEAINQLSK
ncbi:MAG: extracellular solute-binding protein [Spirochaetaceae bacterium]|jgi:multiple sugar transport system substrate-binding protein|nr:extracellular solute-binding protein [Spirochaetaceae bacterium]